MAPHPLQLLTDRPPRASRSRFQDRDAFRSMLGYRLLPFRFHRFTEAEVLLVNEAGEHLFLPATDFTRFARHELRSDEDSYLNLKGKHFLTDSESHVPQDLLAVKFRTRKAHLEGFT